jgi:DNA (cytosine-5)-methyltransferase 1
MHDDRSLTGGESVKRKKAGVHVRARHASGLFDELVIDNFAGGGGASLGIERALGRAVDVAINHDAEAVALHSANHPATLHHCEDVWSVDPFEVARGRPVGLAWFSPDCKHFSRAKGGKPVEKKIRGLAWVVVRWAAKVRPRVIMLENVREFETWGPLGADDRPCPRRRGLTFRRWVGCLRGLGYAVEWRTLDAADYGAPTHRKRLFLVARRDGRPIAWPEPTHGPGRAHPYRTAASCIDWSRPCPSIFLTREEGRALGVIRPLAEKTMRRIAMGLKRYVLDNPRPFIVRVNHGGPDLRGQAADRPRGTVTGKHGYGVVSPFLTAQYGERPGQAPRSHRVDGPIPTVTPRDGGGFPLIAPALIQYNQEKGGETRGKGLSEPLNTVVSANRFGLVSAFISEHYGDRPDGSTRNGRSAERPLPTTTARGTQNMLAGAYVARLCQNGGNGKYTNGADEPLTTIVSKAEHCVAAAYVTRQNHGEKPADDVAEPLRTITTQDNKHNLTLAHLTKYQGTSIGSGPDEPAPTITGGGFHVGEVRAFLTKYYGHSIGQDLADPLHTVTGKARFGVVTLAGQDYLIVDVGLRMLSPRELYRAQGFPDDYAIEISAAGRPLPKSAQVRMCGNSVSPPVAEALVRANYGHAEVDLVSRSTVSCP